MLDIIVLVWLASFRFHLHFCIFVYWARKKEKVKRELSFLLSAIILLFLNLQNAAEPVAAAETLAEVPEHVLRGLPEEVRLFPSAVDKTRIGECWGQGRRGQGEWAVARLPLGASEVGSSLQKQHICTLTCFEEFVFQLRIQGGQEHLTPTHPPL